MLRNAGQSYGLSFTLLVLLGACAPSDDPAAAESESTSVSLERQWQGEGIQDAFAYELPDGRVLLGGMSRTQLLVYNADGQKLAPVGRAGGGPGEFRIPVAVVAVGTTAVGVLDLSLRRLTVFDDSLGVQQLETIPDGHDPRTAQRLPDGRWISESATRREGDSIALVISNATLTADTVLTKLYNPATTFLERGDTGFNMRTEYEGTDRWGVLADGSVWIARVGENRVVWITADGTRSSSAALPFARIPTVPGDLRRWRGLPVSASFIAAERPMAAVKAAFQGVTAAPDGALWFWLNQSDGYTTEQYRCRSPEGEPGVVVTLPYGSRLVHVGRRHMYAYRLTEDADESLDVYAVVPCEAASGG